MTAKRIENIDLDIIIERTKLGGDKVPFGIRYNFKAKISLSKKDAKWLGGYVERIKPENLRVKLDVQQLYYYLDKQFSLEELTDFNEKEFINETCDFIRDEIQNHLNLLGESVDNIKQLTSETEFTQKRSIEFQTQ